MALINCPNCGRQVSTKAQKCPHCGFDVEQYVTQCREKEQLKEKHQSVKVVIFGVAGLFILLFAVFIFTNLSSGHAANLNDTVAVTEDDIVAPVDDYVSTIEDIYSDTVTVIETGPIDICMYGRAYNDEKEFPIQVTFQQQGDYCTNCVYENLTYGTKLNMSATKSGNSYVFRGSECAQEVEIKIYPNGTNNWTGYFSVGDKSLDLRMWL